MTAYDAPLDDIRFALDLVGLDDLAEIEAFEHADPEMVRGVVAEAGRFATQAVAPTNRIGDTEGLEFDPDTGDVRLPAVFEEMYDQYVQTGFGAVSFDPAYGGGGFPWLVTTAIQEMLTSANLAWSLCPLLTQGAIEMLEAHGSDEQKQDYLPRMVSGEWSGTMNLTEPQAGSDVGALTTKAMPNDDGTWSISGQKIYITFGDHQLTDNIIHMVLARVPDAPAGTKGISCFIVPKFLLDEDGNPGERNDVRCISIEHKVGIHVSPTCTLAFGEDTGGATGYLIGEANAGMRYMFTMMNNARLSVGVEGLSIAERAYQQAAQYARDRRQGRAVGGEGASAPKGEASPIVDHPDVRRMLLTMRATIEGMRALTYSNAKALDLAHHHPDADVRAEQQRWADFLTPLSKGFCTDMGVELSSIGIQVHGGMGFVEETGAAQHWRDSRIAPIYEGTNGIQAIDLVGRKLGMDDGEFVQRVLAEVEATVAEVGEVGDGIADIAKQLDDARRVVAETTRWMLDNRAEPQQVFAGATPFARMWGLLACGWLLAKQALAAHGDDTHADRVVTARFFATNVLPQVHGLAPAATAGAEDLFAIDAADL